MESWHLPINLSAQIASDYISEYLKMENLSFRSPKGLLDAFYGCEKVGKTFWFFYLVYLERRNNLTSQQNNSEIIAHSQVTRKAIYA